MKTMKMLTILVLALGLMVWPVEVSEAEPMGTAFTYQGRLMDKNKPADGLYDFQFKLYDSNDPNTGTQLGSPIDINDLDVIDGHFVVELDFGSGIFDGNAVWLETMVVESPLGSDPAALSPLLELTPTPYALYAASGPGVPVPLALSGPVASPGAVISGTNTASGGSGIYGENASTGNYGRLGTNADGVFGRSSASGGSGVAGINDGGGNGVYGRSNNGKGVHGVSSDGLAGYFNGDVTLTKPSGQGGGELVLRTAVYNEPGRYRIRFANNGLGLFAGDDTQDQQYSFVSKWGAIREYDARLSVHGKASGSWGTYIAFTHDGTDGLIETDVGDIVLNPAGNVGIGITNPSAKLDVVGTVNATAFVGDGSGLTGIAGDSDWTESGGNVYRETGNVGIGTTNPRADLEIKGTTGLLVTTGQHSNVFGEFKHAYSGGLIINANAGGGFADISLQTDDTTRLFIESGGHVGIGTTSPDELLHVWRDTGGSLGIRITNADVQGGAYALRVGGSSSVVGAGNFAIYDHSASATRLVVDSTGNVGIGTTAPSAPLDVVGTIEAKGLQGNSGTVSIKSTRDIEFTIDQNNSGTLIGFFELFNGAGSNIWSVNETGSMRVTGGADIRGDEVRIWDGSANVGWAITQGELYVERDLEVDGRIFVLDVYNTGVSGRDVYVASNGELGYVTSSKRYKENITPLDDDFSKILDAQPVTFTAKKSKERGIGFIAEDMDELGLSNLVIYDPQGRPESVRYDWISLYLLEVLKDQDESMKDLKAENESLEQRLEALERTVLQFTQGKEFEL